jgi:hypothetical protein
MAIAGGCRCNAVRETVSAEPRTTRVLHELLNKLVAGACFGLIQ